MIKKNVLGIYENIYYRHDIASDFESYVEIQEWHTVDAGGIIVIARTRVLGQGGL